MRPMTARLEERLRQGDSLSDAIDPEADALPPLFVAMCRVGEETGNLAEIFRDLEDYFELQNSIKRNFRAQIIWPAIQFVLAIFVITLMLLIMGWLNLQMDPIGLGVGPKAALTFLIIVGFWVGAAFLLYRGFTNRVRFLAPVERVILAIPVLGPTLESLLLGRFCIALKMTAGAGLSVKKSVQYSLDATASSYYQQSYQKAQQGLRRGEELTEVLTRCTVFPPEFLDIVANAEQTGQVAEVMDRCAKNYNEEMERRLRGLARLASGLIAVGVALIIISMIVNIYTSSIGPVYRDAMKGL